MRAGPTIAVTEVLTDARVETSSRQKRTSAALASMLAQSAQDPSTGTAGHPQRARGSSSSSDSARPPPAEIAHERHVLRAKLRVEAAVRRAGVIERRGKTRALEQGGSRQRSGHARSNGDLPGQVPEGAGTAEDEAATM